MCEKGSGLFHGAFPPRLDPGNIPRAGLRIQSGTYINVRTSGLFSSPPPHSVTAYARYPPLRAVFKRFFVRLFYSPPRIPANLR
jgi:hypothetical protein